MGGLESRMSSAQTARRLARCVTLYLGFRRKSSGAVLSGWLLGLESLVGLGQVGASLRLNKIVNMINNNNNVHSLINISNHSFEVVVVVTYRSFSLRLSASCFSVGARII